MKNVSGENKELSSRHRENLMKTGQNSKGILLKHLLGIKNSIHDVLEERFHRRKSQLIRRVRGDGEQEEENPRKHSSDCHCAFTPYIWDVDCIACDN